MTYIINVTDHNNISIPTGTVDTSTSLSLVGKNVPNYGQVINQNLVNLMQNFAGTNIPNGPAEGQLWFNSSSGVLSVYNNTVFKPIATIATGNSRPLTSVTGDLWWDPVNLQLNVYSGVAWVTVGPAAINSNAAVVPQSIVDINGVVRDILVMAVDTKTVAIVAKDSFTPRTPVTGFSAITAGINLAASGVIPYNKFSGDVSGSTGNLITVNTTTVNAGNISAGNIGVWGDVSISGALNAATLGNTGTILVGTTTTAAQPNITSLGTIAADLNVTGNANSTNVNVTGNIYKNGALFRSGITSTAATLPPVSAGLGDQWYDTVNNVLYTYISDGASNFWLDVSSVPSAFSNLNVSQQLTINGSVNSNILPKQTNAFSLGSATNSWATVYGASIRALGADLAEKYHSDDDYAAGTVMKIGGTREITRCDEDCSHQVFGVISENPAYVMNNGKNPQWLPVVLMGRSPVMVTGLVLKGQYLVSADNGMARGAKGFDLRVDTLIGRSLVDKTSAAPELIECFINTH